MLVGIVVLQTTTFGSYGGIQTYNRIFAQSLSELSQARVLIGTDQKEDIREASKSDLFRNLKIEAFGGSRAALASRTISLALRSRIDLLIIGHVNYAPLGVVVKRLQPHTKVGVIMHGKDVWLKLPPWRSQALRAADFTLSVSKDTYEQAVKVNGLPEGRNHLLPNAILWKMTEPRMTSGNGNSPVGTRLLSVCRLAANEKQKGVETMIRALPEVTARIPNVQYVVIGTGDDLERHRRLASECGVAEHVHFLGTVDDATLRSHYEAADLFVLPSAQEGFGIVFLEAMRYGKPVVAARFGGTPEVVLDGITGLLVQYDDSAELSAAVIRLCLDANLRKAFGAAGYERLLNNFTYEHFKRRFDQILIDVLPSNALYRSRREVLTPA